MRMPARVGETFTQLLDDNPSSAVPQLVSAVMAFTEGQRDALEMFGVTALADEGDLLLHYKGHSVRKAPADAVGDKLAELVSQAMPNECAACRRRYTAQRDTCPHCAQEAAP